jgi:hypothetical protein
MSATGAPTARAGDDSNLGEPVADTTTAAGPAPRRCPMRIRRRQPSGPARRAEPEPQPGRRVPSARRAQATTAATPPVEAAEVDSSPIPTQLPWAGSHGGDPCPAAERMLPNPGDLAGPARLQQTLHGTSRALPRTPPRSRTEGVPYARPCSWCGSSGKVALSTDSSGSLSSATSGNSPRTGAGSRPSFLLAASLRSAAGAAPPRHLKRSWPQSHGIPVDVRTSIV